jgi:hypothetical protein
MHAEIWLEIPRETNYTEGLGVDAMTILKFILRNRTGRRGLDYPASKQWPVAGLCEHGNKTLRCHKMWVTL